MPARDLASIALRCGETSAHSDTGPLPSSLRWRAAHYLFIYSFTPITLCALPMPWPSFACCTDMRLCDSTPNVAHSLGGGGSGSGGGCT